MLKSGKKTAPVRGAGRRNVPWTTMVATGIVLIEQGSYLASVAFHGAADDTYCIRALEDIGKGLSRAVVKQEPAC
ncbi:hypothetical protein FHX57_007353 [Paraburkholderia tropica]|uniref:Uncharacterized protein n=1 Tax=Paraburkholderia tropica TaxID=92647 RepID=A0ABX5MBN0_9BURK|nr:hypothetical protein [Paraburkholderia tropica]MBB2984222.1 hypothetical protein [Paraburkholderia tropica]MBB3004966.1 hypothetical protein [Paraburkholderia tropica]MBB6323254.1 hypothetical protein [Paraburkholderia tropica]PXX05052.1 hypothetical protein C7400_14418 [Paraburkholderia tropica]PZW70480.1 hypothetical protein C7399_14418 [Paraburkholderia tropica]